MSARYRWQRLLQLVCMACFFTTSACRGDFDPTTETQRLIDKAAADIEKDKAAITALDADMKKISKAFENLRALQKSVDDILIKVRHTNINNTTKMAFKAGLNFTKIIPTEHISEAATDFAFERIADYLNEKFPNSMTGQITQNVGKARDSSVAAVQKFNWTISLSEQELAGYIRMETPELAAKEGSIDDNLIILKHSQLILQSGNLAVTQLDQMMKALLEQHKELARFKGGLQDDIKRLEEDIRSWKRNMGVYEDQKKANEWSKAPDPVIFPGNASYDFGAAGSKMKEAWQKLASGSYSCGSYSNALWDAQSGAQRKLNELITPIYAAAYAACAASGNNVNVCSAVMSNASAAASRLQQAFETQVLDTSRQLHRDAKAMAEGPILAFARELRKWDDNQVDMVIWGEDHTVKIEQQHGDWLATAIWQNALRFSASSTTFPFPLYSLSVKQLAQSEKILAAWQDDAKNLKTYFEKQLAAAKGPAAIVAGLAPTATQLANKLQPNIEIWDCFRSEGDTGYDLALVNFEHVRGQYDRLVHFEAAFGAISRDGEDAARQLIEGSTKSLESTRQIVEVLRGAGAVKTKADRFVATARELRPTQDGNLDVSGGQIYTMLGNYGISDSGLKALEERIKGLSDPATLEKEALSQFPGMPGYSFKNRVLNAQGVSDLKTSVVRALAAIDSARDRYTGAYKTLKEAEASLEAELKVMRDKLSPIFPVAIPYFFMDAVLQDYSEPENYLALLLRDRTGPPEQFPDSGLGSGPLIERYAALAERYHTLVDPYMLVARANTYVPSMEALLKKFREDSGRLQGLGAEAFMNESNRYSNDAYLIYQRASSEGKVEPGSRLSVAYGAIISQMSELSSAYYQRLRLAGARSTLQGAIDGINAFLGNPEAMGGWSSAQQWMDSIGYTKSAVDASVRDHPSIRALMAQLDGLMDKLRAVASNVDTATLQRDTQAIQAMYRDFTTAYQNKNLSGVLQFLSRDWQATDGSDLRDLETTLGNSFRVFDSIAFKISGISIQRVSNFYQVSYQAALSGRINRLQKTHQETTQIVDTVAVTAEGPRIVKTTGMLR